MEDTPAKLRTSTGMMSKCFTSDSLVSLNNNVIVTIIIYTCIILVAPPEPTNCAEQDQARSEGTTVVLEHCEITSPVQLSDLDFQWNKDGEPLDITPEGRYSINHNGFLTISNIRPSDSGLYHVNISNSQGSALHTVRLQVVPGGPRPGNGRLTRFANLLSNIVKGLHDSQ